MQKIFYICILIASFTLSESTIAQEFNFPISCEGRILTPRAEALCGPQRANTLAAESKYLSAFGNLNSLSGYRKLEVIQLVFMSKYLRCLQTGSAAAVSECLNPAFTELIGSLPEFPADQSINLNEQALKAKSALIDQAYGEFDVCIESKIAALDDGISPARDIALGISSFCKQQARMTVNIIMVTGPSFLSESPSFRQESDAIEQLSNPDKLVTAVLKHRAKKRTNIKLK